MLDLETGTARQMAEAGLGDTVVVEGPLPRFQPSLLRPVPLRRFTALVE
jgi:hypothetical protein